MRNRFFTFAAVLYGAVFPAFAGLSFGDASDGDCSWSASGTVTVSQSEWNCRAVFVGSSTTVRFTGAETVRLRAQEGVAVEGKLDVSAAGISPGPGGSAPGSSGSQGTDAGAVLSGGGGGGAGHLNAGSSGNASDDAVAGGAGGSSFGDESSFPDSVPGGLGGAPGGSGDNGAISAGEGGAGGGALVIVAKGDVNLSGSIDASGASGLAGNDDGSNGSGGGGGGSGGSVYLVSASSLTVSGSINVDGGAGGSGGAALSSGGDGGAGSVGRVRLDAPPGALNTGGATIPASTADNLPFPNSISDPLSAGTAELVSDIGYSCAHKEAADFQTAALWFLAGFSVILGGAGVARIR